MGFWPIYSHNVGDASAFRYICAQLIISGVCRQCELVKTFGTNRKRLNRAVTQLNERGIGSFFKRTDRPSRGAVLTPEKLAQAQALLNSNVDRRSVCDELDVDYSTLSKAIGDSRLSENKDPVPDSPASTLSDRSQADVDTSEAIGVACTRPDERLAASLGLVNGVPSTFEPCLDVVNGGVLCALPALIANGLLSKLDKLGVIEGFYSKVQIMLVLAFMLLCRFKNIEQLQGASPGEFGKLVGLDRIPEAKCLRRKVQTLAMDKKADQWAAEITKQWFENNPETTGFLYVDGHVKLYGGAKKLPKRFVSRQRLCLRGISYYWVNDAIGQPFFVVEKQIDHGMLEALRTDIIPRLLKDIPNQPSDDELEANPDLHRFIIVFDREGCSPAFFKKVWDDHRIACMTYRKNKTPDWPESDFHEVSAKTPSGEPITLNMAEKETPFGTGADSIRVREIRKRTERGKQTSIVTTAKTINAEILAPHMFARWGQENFFGYSMHHFGIDQLMEYGSEEFPDTETVVNPRWRTLDRQRRKQQGTQGSLLRNLHAMDSQKGADPHHKSHEKWQIKKSERLEELSDIDEKIKQTKVAIKEEEKHILWSALPAEERFKKLPSSRRTLINTIGMICYRAETAQAVILMETQASLSEGRALLQDLFTTPVDLLPDPSEKLLHIHLHTAATPKRNRQIAHLLNHLNQTHTLYPGTELEMRFHSAKSSPS